MSKYSDRRFWVDAFDRAVSTFAQAFVSVITVGTTGLFDLDWLGALSIAGGAALVSVLTSVGFRGSDPDPEIVVYDN